MKDVSPNEARIFCLAISVIAQVSTIPRLWIRYHTKRLWWDDFWAFLAMLVFIPKEVTLISHGIPKTTMMWLAQVLFTISVWTARTSIMLSIVRLIPPLFTLRRISEYAAVCFVLAGVGMLIPNVYFNTSNKPSNNNLDIGELFVYIAGDITLVAIPPILLYRTTLAKNKQRMLILMFGASVLITVVSVLRVVYCVANWHVVNTVKIVGTLEGGTALAVANLGVLIPFFNRFIKEDGDFDSKPCTHYQSFQSNGEVRVRRVSDLVAAPIRPQTNTGIVSASVHFQEPESETKSGDSDDSPSPDELNHSETPKMEPGEIHYE